MRSSYTAVVERNVEASGLFHTEPYECGWASEAIIFVRCLEGSLSGTQAFVQISPDGMNWCNEGALLDLPGEHKTAFVRSTHFGNWLRLTAELGDRTAKVIVTLHLKE